MRIALLLAVNGALAVSGTTALADLIIPRPLPPDLLTGVESYPNPFDSRKEHATILYTLKEDMAVTISIFDIYGNRVTELSFPAGGQGGQAGVNQVTWDGSAAGRKVSKGVYLAVIKAGAAKKVYKIAVIH